MHLRLAFTVILLGFTRAQIASNGTEGKITALSGEVKPGSALSIQIGTSGQQAKRIQQISGPAGIDDLEALQFQAETANDLAHRVIRECPATTCNGLDCAYVVVNGCRTCVCPIGSPARGCDRLPEKFWQELMLDGCPNPDDANGARTPARKVIRWYRYTDEEKGISECRFYMFPYCTDSDYNFWRSPRTKAECSYYCFRQGGEGEEPVTEVPL